MTESNELGFARGADAARVVAADPFWSTVVRRHAEVDVVVLPPEDVRSVEIPADEPIVDADVARQGLRADLAAFWVALGLHDEPAHVDDTWFAGPVDGTVRWQGTASFDGLDPVDASRLLQRAEELLAAADWHVLLPSEGIPRVLAGRAGRLDRESFQVLLPSTSRAVIRVRSDLVVVGTAVVAEVLADVVGGGR